VEDWGIECITRFLLGATNFRPTFWQGLEALKKACQKFGAESKVIQESNRRCSFFVVASLCLEVCWSPRFNTTKFDEDPLQLQVL